jgi:phospholipase C
MQPGANDAHPPHDIVGADVLIAGVYNAIRKNDKLWNSTLLLVLFDEHGGFYDHVVPPSGATPPDHHSEEYDFTRYGVRVPAILISPYVGNGIFSDLLDHTSLLKYLQEKWDLNDLGYRTAKANTFKAVIDSTAPRTETPPRVDPSTEAVAASAPVEALNEHQSALVAMSHNLETMTNEDANLVAARSRHVLTGPQSQIDTAVDRVDNFIDQQKATVQSWTK